MDIIKLIIGLFFVIFGSSYLFIKVNKKLNNLNDDDSKNYYKMGNQFKITLGFIVIILVGIILIYREVIFLF